MDVSKWCLNPHCNYMCDGLVCTKCGKSQAYLKLEIENKRFQNKETLALVVIDVLEEKIERYREALEKITQIGLRGRTKESIELVGSEHYEAAWLDCVDVAKSALEDKK